MKPKFANFKFYQEIVFKSCSLFKMHKNVSIIRKILKKHLIWAVSLLLYAHFIKPQCNVWYYNTHVAFNVNLNAMLRRDYCCRRKTGFTQVWRCNRHKNTESFTAYKWKLISSLNPNEMSKLRLYKLFNVRSEERSINCSASRDVNPWEAFGLSTRGFLIQLCFSMSSEKYFSKCEIRASKCEHITVFISHLSVFCRERLPDCEFKWDFKSGKLSYCSLFISRSVCHNCIFFLSWSCRSCRRWVSFSWREMFNWFNLKKNIAEIRQLSQENFILKGSSKCMVFFF